METLKNKVVDCTSVSNSVVNNNCTEDNGIGDYSNKEDNQLSPTQDNMMMDSEGLERSDEDLNDSTEKSIGSVELEDKTIRDQLFFGAFWSRTIQMIVVTALLILAVEWQPLQQLLEKNVKYLCVGLVISFIFMILASLKVHQGWCKFIFEMVINMICKLNIYWFMAAFSYKFSIGSPYSVVLAAVIVTGVYFLLTVFIYFKWTNDRDTRIYAFAAIIPILVLLLSPFFYYFLNFIKAKELAMGNYMINVGFGIGFATIVSFALIAILQLGGKWLRYKTDASGKIVSENVESARTPPVRDANNYAKVTGMKRVAEMMNYIYFSEYLSRFLQMVVFLALLILGLKWEPLHQFLLRNKFRLWTSLLVVDLCCAGILLSKFLREKLISMLIIQMVNFVTWFCIFTFICSLKLVVSAAVIVATNYYLLTVALYFKMNIERKCAIYGYFTSIPLILSQLYYVSNEQLSASMSYQDYLFNVCQIIGMATVMIVINEWFGWERDYYAGRALQLFREDSYSLMDVRADVELDVEPSAVNL